MVITKANPAGRGRGSKAYSRETDDTESSSHSPAAQLPIALAGWACPAAAPWAKRITAAWNKQLSSIFETGRLLIEAQDDLGYGAWIAMFEAEPKQVPFGVRTPNA